MSFLLNCSLGNICLPRPSKKKDTPHAPNYDYESNIVIPLSIIFTSNFVPNTPSSGQGTAIGLLTDNKYNEFSTKRVGRGQEIHIAPHSVKSYYVPFLIFVIANNDDGYKKTKNVWRMMSSGGRRWLDKCSIAHVSNLWTLVR